MISMDTKWVSLVHVTEFIQKLNCREKHACFQSVKENYANPNMFLTNMSNISNSLNRKKEENVRGKISVFLMKGAPFISFQTVLLNLMFVIRN